MKKRKIIFVNLIITLLIISILPQMVIGNNAENNISSIKSTKSLSKKTSNIGYTHTVFVEVATSQTCGPCHYMNRNLYDFYNSGDYDFEFVEMIIYDDKSQVLNYKAKSWAASYGIWKFPTVIFDGDYRRIEGNFAGEIPGKLNDCGTRSVNEIIADIDILWLGNATMQIDISIQNNEEMQYNGNIRAAITEIVSRYDTYQGEPYHFGFLDYAFKQPISIEAGEVFTSSVIWYGKAHSDTHGNFSDIAKDNIRAILGVINEEGYVDATVAANPVGDNLPPNKPRKPLPANGTNDVSINSDLSWSCSEPDGEPLKFDVYFGTSDNPPKISSKQTETSYDLSTLEKETKYYWKIVAHDPHGASTSSPIWSFTTKEKESSAPKLEIIKPVDALYINDKKIISRLFLLPLIIGDITIEASAIEGDSEIEKVEFYINNNLKETDTTEPYLYVWKFDHPRLFHLFLIKVIAYGNDGEIAEKQMLVRKFL